MASQQQMKKIKAGVNGWNTWRERQPTKAINLSGADLRNIELDSINLRSANLSSTNLSGASLNSADLTDANLSGADLFDALLNNANLSNANLSSASLMAADFNTADLRGSNLSGADLSSAILSSTNLSNADVSGADLRGANFTNANLTGANLSGAIMHWTILGELDLRRVKGIETIQHDGPSHLSINTLYRSEGDIPEIFVRGTGAPDTFIEYMHALAQKPIQYYTCFISYSSKDQDFADRLYNDLQGNGIRCWFAKKDVKPGDYHRYLIDESIKIYDKVLLILSKHSVKSTWVKDEVELAWKREDEPVEPGEPLVLFPIRLDDTVMRTKTEWASRLRYLRHIGDFTGWKDHDAYQIHLQQLFHDLKKERPQTKQ